jgi:tetratricopeptide (TPR) repeat protein
VTATKDPLNDHLTRLHERFWREHERLREQLLAAIPSAAPQRRPYWRRILRALIGDATMSTTSRLLRVGPAAGVAAALCLITYFVCTPRPALALEQITEALKSVRYIHAITKEDQGRTATDIWVELNDDGFQVKYRCEGSNRLIVDDGEVARELHKDTNTIFLEPSGKYQWIGNMGGFLQDLSGKGPAGSALIERDVAYKGRPAHRVRLTRLNMDCFIDPQTKLPMTIGAFQIEYAQPPAGTFQMAIPPGATIVDRRSAEAGGQGQGTATSRAGADEFETARYALAEKDYAKAEALLAKVVQRGDGGNWGWFWLGRARYELGDLDGAIEAYTKTISIQTKFGEQPSYAYLARGLAYQKKTMRAQAANDLARALPDMIGGLSNPEGSLLFDYADDPTLQYRLIIRNNPLSRIKILQERSQTAAGRMINRLKAATGEDLGIARVDTAEQQARAIAAWQDWWKQHASDYAVKPERLEPYAEQQAGQAQVGAGEEALAEKVYRYKWGQEPAEVSLGLFQEGSQIQPKDPELKLWFAIGLALYDGKNYREALEAFDAAVRLEDQKPSEHSYCPIVWQGHMLDLLGEREKAIERYQQALKRYPGDAHYTQHGQWNIVINRRWIEERLKTPFSRK